MCGKPAFDGANRNTVSYRGLVAAGTLNCLGLCLHSIIGIGWSPVTTRPAGSQGESQE